MKEKKEKYILTKAGLSHTPTREDHLEEREKCDTYYTALEAYEQGEMDILTQIIEEFERRRKSCGGNMEIQYFKGKDDAYGSALDFLNNLKKQLELEAEWD